VLGALIAQVPFDTRPNDYIDIGYVRAILNDHVVQLQETASNGTLTDLPTGDGLLEFGYGFQATPWLHPGTFSSSHIPNAWALGVRVVATL
jgi:porin